MRKCCIGILLFTSFCVSGTAYPQSGPNNYGDDKSWLCRPGRHDACDADMTATIISADGRLTKETWAADPNAPVDCFYVYPTVSTDAAPNSDMIADAAELNVVMQQFTRFASLCKPYAPLYRQVTLAGLRTRLGGGGGGLARGMQYDDVLAAWNLSLDRRPHDRRRNAAQIVGCSGASD